MSTARRGLPIVVSAPSGTGKTTVCRAVVARDPAVVLSVSHTTRSPRPGERDGVDYHFVSEPEFRDLVAKGAFLEHARYSGHLYGTSWAAIEAPLARGLDVLLEIETEGARQVRERRDDAWLVFLLPPSRAELERRLRGRRTDREDEVARRLAIARSEFAAARLFDAFVVNDEIEGAVGELLAIVAAARSGDRARLRGRAGLDAVRARLDPDLVDWLPA
ncbi:MAG TPA: guanylate kinase [Myxococcota bacterium]|nr:guanylate kinase [Myxococcota bacterium]